MEDAKPFDITSAMVPNLNKLAVLSQLFEAAGDNDVKLDLSANQGIVEILSSVIDDILNICDEADREFKQS